MTALSMQASCAESVRLCLDRWMAEELGFLVFDASFL